MFTDEDLDLHENFREFEELIPIDYEYRNHILNYYFRKDKSIYIPNEIKALQIIDNAIENPQYIYNLVKTTRAGCTTNIVKGCTIRNLKVLVVEPTNEISYSTVREIMELYEEATGDNTRKVRQIPSNRDGCSDIVKKVKDNENLNLIPFIIGSKCSECELNYDTFPLHQQYIPKAEVDHCTIKTMMKEKELLGDDWKPDVVTITYDKLLTLGSGERSEFYTEMINNVDVIFFDELGSFITKMEAGIDIQHIKTTGSTTTVEKIKDMQKEVKRTAMIVHSINKNLSFRLIKLLDNFITPFVTSIYDKVTGKDTYPRFINNPLNKENAKVKVKRGNIQKMEWVSKTEAVVYKAREFYEDLESLINYEDERVRETVKWLIELLQMMQYEKFVAFEQEFLEFDGDLETNHHILKITPLINEFIKKIEPWMKNKLTFITDATMPAFSFDMFKKHVVDIYFGDPLNTNAQLMIMNDRRIKKTFSVTRWNKDEDFRYQMMHRIEKYLLYHGNNVIIWTPNKNIWKEVQLILDSFGFPLCTHKTYKKDEENDINEYILREYFEENEEEFKNFMKNEEAEYKKIYKEIKNSNLCKRVLVTYYGSDITRGVKSDRRVQILLGKANKPRNSYKHIAYMQRIQWKLFSQRELENMAKKVDMTVEEYKEVIEDWVKERNAGMYTVRKNDIPEAIRNYFEFYSDAIQQERTYMDTWQAASRVKDSLGKNRSSLICLGWRNQEIWEMVKWGSNKSIKYVPHMDFVQRTSASQRSLIPPPRVLELENIHDVARWMEGGEMDERLVGFDVDLQNGVFNMLMKGRDFVESEEVWLELSKNLMVGETTETHKNGYMVGSVRAFKKFNDFGDDIECKEIGKLTGEFEFEFSKTDKEARPQITFEELEIIIQILKFVYKSKKDRIVYRDVQQNLRRINPDKIKRCLDLIIYSNLLKGSTWGAKPNKKGGSIDIIKNVHDYMSINKKIAQTKVDFEHKVDIQKLEIMKIVLNWYEKSSKLDLTSSEIYEQMNHIKKPELIKHIKELFKDGFDKLGINCTMIVQPMGRGEKIIIVRAVAKI